MQLQMLKWNSDYVISPLGRKEERMKGKQCSVQSDFPQAHIWIECVQIIEKKANKQRRMKEWHQPVYRVIWKLKLQ
jgi:hypothetical protein